MSQKPVKSLEKNKICRLCAQNGRKFKDISSDEQTETSNLVRKYLGISFTNEDRFRFTCKKCDKTLNEWNRFLNQVEVAEVYFQSLLKNEDDTKQATVSVDIKAEDEFLENEAIKEELIANEDELSEEIFLDNSDSIHSDFDEGNSPGLPDPTENLNKRSTKTADADQLINKFFNFTCPECIPVYKINNWQLYRKHLTQRHSETQPSIVMCCNSRLQLCRRTLLIHTQYHLNPEEFQCKFCQKQYFTYSGKKRHEVKHKLIDSEALKKKNERLRVTCNECGKILMDKFSYRKHMRLHLSTEEKVKLRVQCDLCKKYFRDKSNLATHLKSMHMPKEKSFACDQCAKIFASKGTFLIHYASHTGENRVVCPECGLEVRSSSLQRHKDLKHDHTPQTCSICFKTFKNYYTLKTHQQRIHIEPKFECDLCEKKFKSKSYLKEHRGIHFTSYKYSCDQCEYISSNYGNMLRHRKTRHVGAPMLSLGTAKKVFEGKNVLI